MKLKRMFGGLLATTLVASMALTGCGGSGNATSDTNAAADTKAAADSSASEGGSDVQAADKIIIFQSKVEIQDALEDCAEQFTSETGIQVEIWGTTGDDYLQQLKTKLANNQGPTIFNLGGPAEFGQLGDYCTDLTGLDVLGQMPENVLIDSTYDGKTLGVPYTVEGFGIVYNKDLCDATTLTSTDD